MRLGARLQKLRSCLQTPLGLSRLFHPAFSEAATFVPPKVGVYALALGAHPESSDSFLVFDLAVVAAAQQEHADRACK